MKEVKNEMFQQEKKLEQRFDLMEKVIKQSLVQKRMDQMEKKLKMNF